MTYDDLHVYDVYDDLHVYDVYDDLHVYDVYDDLHVYDVYCCYTDSETDNGNIAHTVICNQLYMP